MARRRARRRRPPFSDGHVWLTHADGTPRREEEVETWLACEVSRLGFDTAEVCALRLGWPNLLEAVHVFRRLEGEGGSGEILVAQRGEKSDLITLHRFDDAFALASYLSQVLDWERSGWECEMAARDRIAREQAEALVKAEAREARICLALRIAAASGMPTFH